MWMFYIGGVVGDDIIYGLLCVVELFEVCIFKGVVLIVEVIGWIVIEEIDKIWCIVFMFDDGMEEYVYLVLCCLCLFVVDGDYVEVGIKLV